MIERAADTYATIVCRAPDEVAPGLVPRGLPAGELDALLRRDRRTAEGDLVPPGRHTPERRSHGRPAGCRPSRGAHPVLRGLLPAAWSRDRAARRARRPPAGVVGRGRSPGELDREPAWWRQVYACAGPRDRGSRCPRRAACPPCGRTHGSWRARRLPADPRHRREIGATLGLRIVHPTPRIHCSSGSVPLPQCRALLQDPAVQAAVAGEGFGDPEATRDAVLALVEAADLAPGEHSWLGQLSRRRADRRGSGAGGFVAAAARRGRTRGRPGRAGTGGTDRRSWPRVSSMASRCCALRTWSSTPPGSTPMSSISTTWSDGSPT